MARHCCANEVCPSDMNIQSPPDQEDIETALGLDGRGRRKTWLKGLIWLAILGGAAAGGFWWYGQQGATNAITYTAEPVNRVDLVVKVQATGKIQPTTQVDVSSEMSGVIRIVNVDNNSIVRKGDVLAELDSVKLKAQLDRANALLAAAQARVLTAKATVAQTDLALERSAALQKKGISSAQEFETASATHDRAAAGLAEAMADIGVAEADVKLQQADAGKSRIVSPVNGIVLKRTAEPGQTVASSLQAPILFRLAEDLARMQVEANVDEADIGVVKPGQRARFTVDAYPGQDFPAVIETIEYSPETTDNVVTYTAILSVDNKALLLRPGMTATAQIVVREIPGAMAVANAALRYEPPKIPASQGFSLTNLFMPRFPRFEKSSNKVAVNGERTLYILVNGGARPVSVKTGASDGQLTEIVSGDLKQGDQVISDSKQGQP